MFLRRCANLVLSSSGFFSCRSISCLLVCLMVLPSCAITKTETKTVQGKELSRTSLGVREVESKLSMKELSPTSMSITRHLCEADFIRTEFQEDLESVHGRQELHCAWAYPQYFAFQIVALGMPLLYDLVTGFDIFRDMCDKDPPIYTNTTVPIGTVTKDRLDTENTVCKEVPVPGAEVTAIIGNSKFTLVTSESGIAALTPEQIASAEKNGRMSVQYRFEKETITTALKQPSLPESRAATKLDVQQPIVKRDEISSEKQVRAENITLQRIKELQERMKPAAGASLR